MIPAQTIRRITRLVDLIEGYAYRSGRASARCNAARNYTLIQRKFRAIGALDRTLSGANQ